jgi:hypothetical protein
MAVIPISALPAGGPVTGTELIPADQGGATVSLLSAALVGPAGPAGPAGPTGPPGPVYPYSVATIGGDYTATDADDVIFCSLGAASITITLNALGSATFKPKVIKWTNAAGATSVTIQGNGADTIDGAASFVLNNVLAALVLWPHAMAGAWRVTGLYLS